MLNVNQMTMKKIDNLPEPKLAYTFRWDGGDLPRRHEAFSFECNAQAIMAAREFMNEHHIDIINVFEGDGTDMRRIVRYAK